MPKHWGVTPLKYVVNLQSGGTPSKTNLAYWDGGDIPWASSKDLKAEVLADTEDHITQVAIDESAAELIPAGSLLIVVRGMILIHTFPVVRALVPMAINQDLKALTPSESLSVDFLAWLLRGASHESLGRTDEAAHGTTVLRMESWTSIELPIPPLAEQTIIATFLDRETAKIDALVMEQRRLIELLEEKRQAVISHAVTKGLNPHAPKKDSRIEWLGEVPTHWVVMRLRRCALSVQTGRTPSNDFQSVDVGDGLVWYTPGDFGDSLHLTASARKISPEAVASGEATIFPPKSVLIVSIGATLGKVGYAEEQSSANQQINAVIPGEKLDGCFLGYSLSAKAEVMRFLSNASTIGIMNQEKTKDIWIAVPPLQEQRDITVELGVAITRLDALTAEAQRAIDLLQERRTALISAAVTGQIDVRQLAESQAAA